MKLNMLFKDYFYQMGAASNEPLSVQSVLKPFGVADAPTGLDPHLLVGHVMDALAEEFLETEIVDPSDILRVLEELGADVSGNQPSSRRFAA
ncbi:MAG: hypothetical protein NTV34_06810 [Proteobacteria bacterium]|nr:hypothetical protein [Pseudomonadota bacterium]